MTIYLVHPISCMKPEDVFPYFENTANDLRAAVSGLVVLSPLTGKSHLRTDPDFRAHGCDNPRSTNHHIIVSRIARKMVAQADVVYANLTGTDQASIGCMMEMAWAYDQPGTYTVTAMEAENTHRHAFVLEAADIVFETHEETMEYLIDFLREVV